MQIYWIAIVSNLYVATAKLKKCLVLGKLQIMFSTLLSDLKFL